MAVSPPDIFSIKKSDDNKSSTLQRVRFSSVQLEHSVSVPESTASWQESSFEHSDTGETREIRKMKPSELREVKQMGRFGMENIINLTGQTFCEYSKAEMMKINF